MYGGEDFERDVKEYIRMVDAACDAAGHDTLRQMQEHFLTSCKLEHMFWDQAQALMKWPDIVASRRDGKPSVDHKVSSA
jgi:thiaminase (transcriptional activator TenA)